MKARFSPEMSHAMQWTVSKSILIRINKAIFTALSYLNNTINEFDEPTEASLEEIPKIDLVSKMSELSGLKSRSMKLHLSSLINFRLFFRLKAVEGSFKHQFINMHVLKFDFFPRAFLIYVRRGFHHYYKRSGNLTRVI